MSMSARPKASKLRRDLGLVHAVGVGLGAMVGAGIFVVIGVAAGVAGQSLLLSVLLAACVASCNGLSSAELAARYPASGGSYEYGYQLLHPWAGFSAGWLFLVSKLAAAGAVALGLGHYVQPWLGWDPRVCGLVALGVLTLANLAGIQKAGRLNLGIVFITLAGLGTFAAIGASAPAVAQPTFDSNWSTWSGAAVIFFAFTGYARIATLAEEVHEPRVTIPRAVVISLALATIIYLAVAWVALRVLGAEGMAATKTPLLDAAKQVGSQPVTVAVSIAAATSMLGVLLSQILGISRMMLAMARRSDLPSGLAHVSRHGVPAPSVLVTAGLIAGITLLGRLEAAISTAALAILIYYTVANLAALRLAKADKFLPSWVAWLGLIGCLALAGTIRAETLAVGLGLLFMGFALRKVSHRRASVSSIP